MVTAKKKNNPDLIIFEKEGVSDKEMLAHAEKTIRDSVRQVHKKKATNWTFKLK